MNIAEAFRKVLDAAEMYRRTLPADTQTRVDLGTAIATVGRYGTRLGMDRPHNLGFFRTESKLINGEYHDVYELQDNHTNTVLFFKLQGDTLKVARSFTDERHWVMEINLAPQNQEAGELAGVLGLPA